jgi:GDP-L-fucose synthase
MATVVVRPSNVYGPGDKFDWDRSHVTAALVRRVVERHDPLEIWGTGEDQRDLIYVDDFITGVFQAFAAAGDHLTVNIGSGRLYSVREILFTAMAVDNFSAGEVRFDPARPRTIGRLEMDISLARRLFNFQPMTELAEGLRRTIDWYRSEMLPEGRKV